MWHVVYTRLGYRWATHWKPNGFFLGFVWLLFWLSPALLSVFLCGFDPVLCFAYLTVSPWVAPAIPINWEELVSNHLHSVPLSLVHGPCDPVQRLVLHRQQRLCCVVVIQ